MQRTATAIWRGAPESGEGTISTGMGELRGVVYRPRYGTVTGSTTRANCWPPPQPPVCPAE